MRRRKPRVVWLPPTNIFSTDTGFTTWSRASVTFSAAVAGNRGNIEVPLVQDGIGSDVLDPTSTIADIENSGYRLRRICGMLYVFMSQPTPDAGSGAVRGPTGLFGISCGLMVRRTDSATGGSLAAAADPTFDSISPDAVRNSMDPWIWKRDFLLNDGFAVDPIIPGNVSPTDLMLQTFATDGPWPTNARAPLHEGPYIDQKTARIIGQEERLFLDVSANTINIGGDSNGNAVLSIIYTLRVLGSMRTNIGNRRNATR